MDQTVIGNPVHDLIRLGLFLATAARGYGWVAAIGVENSF
jgi:uncharacterized protein (DUF2252 family)